MIFLLSIFVLSYRPLLSSKVFTRDLRKPKPDYSYRSSATLSHYCGFLAAINLATVRSLFLHCGGPGYYSSCNKVLVIPNGFAQLTRVSGSGVFVLSVLLDQHKRGGVSTSLRALHVKHIIPSRRLSCSTDLLTNLTYTAKVLLIWHPLEKSACQTAVVGRTSISKYDTIT